MRYRKTGFTLIELMVVVAVLGILAAIGVLQYEHMLRKSSDALTKGNLGGMRSALSIYYGDNEGIYPVDNLSSITNNARYLQIIPIVRILPSHHDSSQVTVQVTPTESGGWSYNNDSDDVRWGTVRVGCLHDDARGRIWTLY